MCDWYFSHWQHGTQLQFTEKLTTRFPRPGDFLHLNRTQRHHREHFRRQMGEVAFREMGVCVCVGWGGGGFLCLLWVKFLPLLVLLVILLHCTQLESSLWWCSVQPPSYLSCVSVTLCLGDSVKGKHIIIKRQKDPGFWQYILIFQCFDSSSVFVCNNQKLSGDRKTKGSENKNGKNEN